MLSLGFALLWQGGERVEMFSKPSSKTSKTEWGQWKGGWTGSKQRWNSCEAYRRARVEHSRGLAELWTRIDNWEIPGNRIKEEASKIMDEEAQLSKQVEDQAQAKSQELSRGPLEWVSGDRAGGFQLILQRGEPTRMMSESIRQHINAVISTSNNLAKTNLTKSQRRATTVRFTALREHDCYHTFGQPLCARSKGRPKGG